MAGASHVSGAAPEPEAALRKLAPMSSDLKVAFLVLQDIGSKDLDQYIESIKNDAPKVQNEIEVLRKKNPLCLHS